MTFQFVLGWVVIFILKTHKTMFYNTINLKETSLLKAKRDVYTQNTIILEFFRIHAKQNFTPTEVHEALFTKDTPITSVRRAITTLTSEGKLTPLTLQRPGAFGKPNYCWTYNTH